MNWNDVAHTHVVTNGLSSFGVYLELVLMLYHHSFLQVLPQWYQSVATLELKQE